MPQKRVSRVKHPFNAHYSGPVCSRNIQPGKQSDQERKFSISHKDYAVTHRSPLPFGGVPAPSPFRSWRQSAHRIRRQNTTVYLFLLTASLLAGRVQSNKFTRRLHPKNNVRNCLGTCSIMSRAGEPPRASADEGDGDWDAVRTCVCTTMLDYHFSSIWIK